MAIIFPFLYRLWSRGVEQLWPGAGLNLTINTDRKNIFNPPIAINVNINERLPRESMLLNQFSFYPSHAHWIAPTICWLLEIFNQNPMDILSLFNFSNVLWRLDVVQFFVRIFVLSVDEESRIVPFPAVDSCAPWPPGHDSPQIQIELLDEGWGQPASWGGIWTMIR